MKAKIISNEEEYQKALAYIETLMDAEPGSMEEDELNLFSMLIELYEEKHYPVELPDPVEAIKFRMEQQELQQKDLIPYIGSQSKVSEILNRKRSLSLSMIRKLHSELGIPAEILLQEKGQGLTKPVQNLQEYPFTEMYKKGYFQKFHGKLSEAKEYMEELIKDLLSVFPGEIPDPLYCKHSEEQVNKEALIAWQAKVITMINEEKLPPYNMESLNKELFRNLVHFSYLDTGPQLVKDYLNKKGIHFVILSHLSKTYLDGATFLTPSGRPVIAMTLRHDRLDNFWFTLMHELGHIKLHLKDNSIAFFDDTEKTGNGCLDPKEEEANQFAKDHLIPPDEWIYNIQPDLDFIGKNRIKSLSNYLEISPAILAGRIRHETNDFTKFSDLIGNKQVRKQFQ